MGRDLRARLNARSAFAVFAPRRFAHLRCADASEMLVGASVAVAVGVSVGMSVAVDVWVGVSLAAGVCVGIWVAVNVCVGVSFAAGVCVGVSVAARVCVGVRVAVGKCVGVSVAVDGWDNVGDSVAVGVSLGALVGVPSLLDEELESLHPASLSRRWTRLLFLASSLTVALRGECAQPPCT